MERALLCQNGYVAIKTKWSERYGLARNKTYLKVCFYEIIMLDGMAWNIYKNKIAVNSAHNDLHL